MDTRNMLGRDFLAEAEAVVRCSRAKEAAGMEHC
jgi:hypothetical protein